MALTERLPDTVENPFSAAMDFAEEGPSPIARLAALHAEAEITARLANLLGRSIVAAAALAGLTGLTIAAGMHSLNASLAWAALVMLGVGAMARIYRAAIASPFSRESLEIFARALAPITLYCGFAWGAGAFLTLPADTGFIGAALFVAAPTLVMAALLRAQEPVLAFVLPMLALSSFAALLRPLPDATLSAALMLLAAAAIAAPAIMLEHRRVAAHGVPPMLAS